MKRILFGITLFISLAVTASAGPDLGLKTVVIDPGHGGKDPGCVSADRKSFEKTFVLDISKKLAERIREGYPDVNVHLTRNDDTFIPLINRARFATRREAALFISIHVNAQAKGTNANGWSVHLLGQSEDKNKDTYAFNMDVCQRENSVIYLEEDYNTTYKGFGGNDPQSAIFLNLMHTAYREQSLMFADKVNERMAAASVFRHSHGVMQNNFAVLRLATMPAVLIECGFITNPGDLAALRGEGNLDKIAGAIYEAFCEYKKFYDDSVRLKDDNSTPVQTPAQPAPAAAAEPDAKAVSDTGRTKPAEPSGPAVQAAQDSTAAPATKVPAEDPGYYGTQIFASGNRLPAGDSRFLGYEAKAVPGVSIYRYVIGTGDSLEKARAEYEIIKKTYPDSFIVFVKDGVVSRPR